MLCPCEESLCVRKCCSPEKILSFSGNQTKCIEHHQNNSEEWKPDFGEGSPNLTYVTVIGSNICKPDQGIYVLNPNLEEPHKEFYILENGQPKMGPEASAIPDMRRCGGKEGLKRSGGISPSMNLGEMWIGPITPVVPEMRLGWEGDWRELEVEFFRVRSHPRMGSISRGVPKMRLGGFVIQFSFLAAFFWLNVMCIDISWTFSGILPPQGTVVERDRKKCIFYSLYAWGSTILILVISLIMEFTPGIPDTFLKPGFGKQTCWFETASIPLRDVTILLEGVVKCAHVPLHWKEEPDTHVLSPALTIPESNKFAMAHAGADGKVRWRCAVKKCSAKLYTDNIYTNVIIDSDTIHIHEVVKNIDRQVISNGVKRIAKENVCERPSKLIRSELAKYHVKDITTHDIALARKNIYVASRGAVPKLPMNQKEVLKAVEGE
uniref:Uncharacterized protein n=1 Tax=Timema tahoe TaxID=61484 RepID=A0A7R9FM82_9NEOP|nr:unnamed protein product [Timema tahoe]